MNRLAAAAATLAACGAAVLVACASAERSDHWSQRELATLRSLSLDELGGPPRDPSNRVADDRRAARLGRPLFSDRHLSRDGTVSCASCHDPKRSFQDGRPRGKGLGLTRRRTMTILGSAWAPWLFWDGRKDSLWAQALAPIQSPAEQGMTPARVRDLIERRYRSEYEAVFGPLPRDARHVFADVGKAIAAFERTLRPSATRFDRYVAGDTGALSEQEVVGLRLFIGEAHCINCHNGPLLTNNDFHNTGVPGSRDRGRAVGSGSRSPILTTASAASAMPDRRNARSFGSSTRSPVAFAARSSPRRCAMSEAARRTCTTAGSERCTRCSSTIAARRRR